jgi:type IV fimbrial biogenesis protein FimT
MTGFNTSKGLTLVELCTTLSIIAIATLSAVSYAPAIIQHHTSDYAIKEIAQAFRFARTEAIMGRSIVTVCPLNTSGKCTNHWNNPISIFRDPDNSHSLTRNEVVIRQVKQLHRGTLAAAPSHRRYFQFATSGESRGTAGNITYCPKSTDPRFIRRLIVNFAGRIRLAQDTNNDGQIENANGSPIICR